MTEIVIFSRKFKIDFCMQEQVVYVYIKSAEYDVFWLNGVDKWEPEITILKEWENYTEFSGDMFDSYINLLWSISTRQNIFPSFSYKHELKDLIQLKSNSVEMRPQVQI